MGNYTAFRDGYLRETTFGSSIITAAADQTYLWGIRSQEAAYPSPSTNVIYRATGVHAQEVPDGELWKGVFHLTSGMYAIILQNGVILQAVMGASTTVDAAPLYTHTIVPPTDGSLLPSFTIHHEKTGTATDMATQFMGCKVSNLALGCNWEFPVLHARVDWLAAEAQDPNLGGTNAMLTNDPALPATATATTYPFGGMTRTFDSNAIDGLTSMELSINPGLSPIFADTWDAGTYTGRWAHSFVESPRKDYRLVMRYHPDSDDLWDELIATGNTKDIVFKWAKSTDDYIEATLTDVQVISHEIKSPDPKKPELIEEVICEPRQVSFEVKDTIAGDAAGAYGE